MLTVRAKRAAHTDEGIPGPYIAATTGGIPRSAWVRGPGGRATAPTRGTASISRPGGLPVTPSIRASSLRAASLHKCHRHRKPPGRHAASGAPPGPTSTGFSTATRAAGGAVIGPALGTEVAGAPRGQSEANIPGRARHQGGHGAPKRDRHRGASTRVGERDVGQHTAVRGVRRPVAANPIPAVPTKIRAPFPLAGRIAELIYPFPKGRRRRLGPLVHVRVPIPGISGSIVLGALPCPVGLPGDGLVQDPAERRACGPRRRATEAPGVRTGRLHGQKSAHPLAEVLLDDTSGRALVRLDQLCQLLDDAIRILAAAALGGEHDREVPYPVRPAQHGGLLPSACDPCVGVHGVVGGGHVTHPCMGPPYGVDDFHI